MPPQDPSASLPVEHWRDAEAAAARHMRERLRFVGVRLSREGTDDGVDVHSREGIAQVKWYASPVGIADVQRLRGTATHGEWALFYASSRGYTAPAIDAATRGNVALFIILAASGQVVAANHVARTLERMRDGIPQSTSNIGDHGHVMAVSRRHWELNSLVSQFEKRVSKLDWAIAHMYSATRNSSAEPAESKPAGWIGLVWQEDAAPDAYELARSSFRSLVAWDHHLADGIYADKTEVIAYQEGVLPKLPALVDAIIDAVPVSRSDLNDWCDQWIERRFRDQYAVPIVWPKLPALRERIERRISRGPQRPDFEAHAKLVAIRVVL